MLVYGLGDIANDFWLEQVLEAWVGKPGHPNVLEPRADWASGGDRLGRGPDLAGVASHRESTGLDSAGALGGNGRTLKRAPAWRAIVLWLVFVALAVGAMIETGTEFLQNGAVGESARGYSLIDRYQAYPPVREYGYVHSDALTTGGHGLPRSGSRRCGPHGARVSAAPSMSAHLAIVIPSSWQGSSGRSISIDDFRASVLAAADLHTSASSIEETGADISASAARDRVVSRDLKRAEILSVPVTLSCSCSPSGRSSPRSSLCSWP